MPRMTLAMGLLPAAALAALLGLRGADAADAGAAGGSIRQYKTYQPGYNFYVYVPKSYSDENPAGLHLFFHSEGSAGGAPYFEPWAESLLEPFNLIGINMQYNEPDDDKFAKGREKAAAALEAIKQTAADFKIVPGRGVVASLSGGGVAHEALMAALGASCPFNHAALYNSWYHRDPAAGPPMSWMLCVGTNSWTMGHGDVGPNLTRLATRLLANAARGGCADVYMRIEKDRGLAFSPGAVKESAAQFRRSDLAFAPFLYEPGFTEKQVQAIAGRANAGELGKASAAADSLAQDPDADPKVKEEAARLKARIDARIEAVLALVKELAAKDPVLCASYGAHFQKQLVGSDRANDLKTLLAETRKTASYRTANALFAQFCAGYKGFIQNRALRDGTAPFLAGIVSNTPPDSLLWKMATDMKDLERGF